MHELYSLGYNCLIVAIHYIVSRTCHGNTSHGYNWWCTSGKFATNNYYSNFAVITPVPENEPYSVISYRTMDSFGVQLTLPNRPNRILHML